MALVLLDVDGVVSPLPRHSAQHSFTGGVHNIEIAPDLDAVTEPAWDDSEDLIALTPLSRQLGTRLGALPAQLMWATTWGVDANLIADVFGWEHLKVLERGEHPGWWKLAAVTAALEEHNPRRAVWCDDDLARHLDDVLPAVHKWGDRLLLISPDPHIGLRPEDLDRIEAHLTSP